MYILFYIEHCHYYNLVIDLQYTYIINDSKAHFTAFYVFINKT